MANKIELIVKIRGEIKLLKNRTKKWKREYMREYMKEYRARFPERCTEYVENWRKRNPYRYQEVNQKTLKKNKERIRRRQLDNYYNNHNVYLIYHQLNYLMKKDSK